MTRRPGRKTRPSARKPSFSYGESLSGDTEMFGPFETREKASSKAKQLSLSSSGKVTVDSGPNPYTSKKEYVVIRQVSKKPITKESITSRSYAEREWNNSSPKERIDRLADIEEEFGKGSIEKNSKLRRQIMKEATLPFNKLGKDTQDLLRFS